MAALRTVKGSQGSLLAEIVIKYLKAEVAITEHAELKEPLYTEGELKLRNGGAIAWHVISQQHKDIATALLPPRGEAVQRQWLAWFEERPTAAHLASALIGRSFLADEHLTLADFVAFIAIRPWLLTGAKDCSLDIMRWADHLQHLPGWPLDKIPNLIDVPPRPAIDVGKVGGASEIASKKKEKKQPSPAVKAVPERPVEDPTRLEIRVGKVLKVWPHPEADKLWCEEIDIGEAQPRNIASGLRAYVTQEEFENRLVFVLANMKEKKLRGFGSHGMVICASVKEGAVLPEGVKNIELLPVPEGAKIGDLVTFEGLEGEFDPVMNTKTGKDPCVAVLPGFRSDSSRRAFWKSHAWVCAGKPVLAHNLADANLS